MKSWVIPYTVVWIDYTLFWVITDHAPANKVRGERCIY